MVVTLITTAMIIIFLSIAVISLLFGKTIEAINFMPHYKTHFFTKPKLYPSDNYESY
jgi:hypothetical protein